MWVSPQKHIQSRQDVVLAPCVYSLCPAVPSAQCIKTPPHRKQVLCSRMALHGMSLCHTGPWRLQSANNRMWYHPVFFQFSLLGMRSVFKLCTWPLKARRFQSKGQSWRAAFHTLYLQLPYPEIELDTGAVSTKGQKLISDQVFEL